MARVREQRYCNKHHTVGWLQIILGMAAIITQIANIVICKLDLKNITTTTDFSTLNYYLLRNSSCFIVYFATGIWTGVVFIIVGACGAAMKRIRRHERLSLRTAVMVLAIVNAIVFAPALITAASIEISWVNSIIISGLMTDETRLICPSILLVIGITEFVATIVAASFCCCYNEYGQRFTPRNYYKEPEEEIFTHPYHERSTYPYQERSAYPYHERSTYPYQERSRSVQHKSGIPSSHGFYPHGSHPVMYAPSQPAYTLKSLSELYDRYK